MKCRGGSISDPNSDPDKQSETDILNKKVPGGKYMVFDRIKEIIVEQLGVDGADITPETSLVKDLEADSLDAVEIIMAIEEEYEIEVPDEEAEKFASIGDIVKYVEDHAEL